MMGRTKKQENEMDRIARLNVPGWSRSRAEKAELERLRSHRGSGGEGEADGGDIVIGQGKGMDVAFTELWVETKGLESVVWPEGLTMHGTGTPGMCIDGCPVATTPAEEAFLRGMRTLSLFESCEVVISLERRLRVLGPYRPVPDVDPVQRGLLAYREFEKRMARVSMAQLDLLESLSKIEAILDGSGEPPKIADPVHRLLAAVGSDDASAPVGSCDPERSMRYMNEDMHAALRSTALPGGHQVTLERSHEGVWKELRLAGLVEGESLLTITSDGVEALYRWRYVPGAG